MVKFGKNKFKALNKIAKSHKTASTNVSNKVIKKKLNAEKKVSFQKEVLIKEAAAGKSPLAQNVTAKKILDGLTKKAVKPKSTQENAAIKTKVKSVEKHRKRQKTQISDTKLLLSLMKKKQS